MSGPLKLVVGMIACLKPQKSPVDFVDVAALRPEGEPAGPLRPGGAMGTAAPGGSNASRNSVLGSTSHLLGGENGHAGGLPQLGCCCPDVPMEGLRCVFSEAMAGDLPIVATNVDGAREAIVDGENGFLHQPHDVEGMSGSVLKLIQMLNSDKRWANAANLASWNLTSAASVSKFGVCLPGVPGFPYDSAILWCDSFSASSLRFAGRRYCGRQRLSWALSISRREAQKAWGCHSLPGWCCGLCCRSF